MFVFDCCKLLLLWESAIDFYYLILSFLPKSTTAGNPEVLKRHYEDIKDFCCSLKHKAALNQNRY